MTSDSYMVDRDRLTAASPTGAFNLALEWIARRHGRDLVEAVVDILASRSRATGGCAPPCTRR